ncbi:MAG: hypothetical protein ACLQVF_30000 [Isosphaeraceae bacterium]
MSRQLEPRSEETEPSREGQACLERTRTAVLNVLIAVGLCIALSGGLLRFRTEALAPSAARNLHQKLMAGLIVISVISYAARRILSQQAIRGQAASRQSLFYWSHLLPALIAALAAPLGLAYGWWVNASFRSVVPFWIAALALGSLALPRAREVEYFDRSASSSGSVPP